VLLTPTDGTAGTVTINLLAAKWQRVESRKFLGLSFSDIVCVDHVFSTLSILIVTIFVENNHGSDFTYLHALRVFGAPIHGTDVAKISKGWYVLISASPASHSLLNSQRLLTFR
jgi:hypothetical protein